MMILTSQVPCCADLWIFAYSVNGNAKVALAEFSQKEGSVEVKIP
jgi:hypothetical protein